MSTPGVPEYSPVPPPPSMQAATYPDGKSMVTADGQPASPKSRLACTLLCFIIGVLGIHRFYVGKIGTGILMLVTLGGLGIWVLIDLILILVGSFRDKEGRVVYNW
jgi:TM2 domain-containing membrane protein YozV